MSDTSLSPYCGEGHSSKSHRRPIAYAVLLGAVLMFGLLAGPYDEASQAETNQLPHPPFYNWPGLADAKVYSMLLPQAYAQVSDTSSFVTTWNITGAPTDQPQHSYASIRFHIDVASGGQVSIDWGDGSAVQNVTKSGPVSTYYLYTQQPSSPITTTVAISGDLERFYFHYNNPRWTEDSPELLISLDQWGDTAWSDMSYMFSGTVNMQYEADDAPNLSSNPRVTYMFRNSSFNGDLSNWDVSQMTNLRYMFASASSFNGNLSNWDVSKVTDMIYMFVDADSFNGNLSNWDVSKVTDMTYMFVNANSFNGDLSNWNVSSVQYMTQTFLLATSFNSDLSNWDVSSAKDMYGMFSYASSFNGDLSNWDVSSVIHYHNMFEMFYNAIEFDGNLGSWFIVLEDTSVDNGQTSVADISTLVGFDTGIDNYNITGTDASYFTITDGRLVLNSVSDYSTKSRYDITITADTANIRTIGLDVKPSISASIKVNPSSETVPTITHITRYDPATQVTDSETLQFKVAFSETVTGVGTDDFELSPDGPSAAVSNTFTYSSAPSLFVPFNVSKADTIAVSDSAIAASVSVSVNITHAYIGDLKVDLIAPDGTTKTLHNRTGGSSRDIVATYTPDFGSVSINGDWQLRIHDNYDADEGTLNSWSLALGEGVDPITSVTGSGSQYYVTVDSSQEGTYNLDVTQDNDITDSANTSLSSLIPSGSDQPYTVTAPVDDTPPVITLVGQSAVSVGVGTTYVDDGATCEDDTDGDISSRIAVSNDVNTNVAQTYEVTFTCTDDAGNPATQVTRTVTVADLAPTVASITRYDPAAEDTDGDTLQFKVAFSETVTGVGTDDFELSPGSPGTDSQTFTYSSSPSLFVPFNVSKADTIAVSDSAIAASVSVSVNITHAYIGDLKVDLVAPDGTTETLHNRTGGSSRDIVATYAPDFGSVSINGDWQLRIHDNYDADEGTLNSWSLALGEGVDPITSVTGSGSQYYVTVDSSQEGTYNLDVTQDNDITDSANNSLSSLIPSGSDQSYTVSAAN